jgi:hypothetical protein
VAQFRGSKTFTVPLAAGEYAPERLTLAKSSTQVGPDSLIAVTALITSAVTAAVLELWLLKFGGDPAVDADWSNTGNSITASGGDTWPLAGWDGAQLRAKSGGTAGSLGVSATAD